MLRSPSCRRSLRSSSPRFLQPLVIRDENGCQILECRVDGYPKPEVQWEKSGKPVAKSRRIHMLRSGDTCLLQIKMPQIEDAGLYTCTATNIIGTTTTQTKFSFKHLEEKNMNGSLTEKRSPAKSKEVRSRSTERRNVNSTADDTLSTLHSGTRSRSASRDSRQNSQNTTSKSKFSHFSQIWRKNEEKSTDRSLREQVAHPSKKQLSKSMEDCRKNRKSFLRVKIPDIFIGDKPEVTSPADNQKLPSVKKLNGELRTNGVISHSVPQNRTLSTAGSNRETLVSNRTDTFTQSKPKKTGRISSYLKRFESATAASKQKEPSKTHGGSIKQSGVDVKHAVSAAEQRQITNDEPEGSFFKFGKFMRRKSSSSNSRKSSVDVNENNESNSTFFDDTGEKCESSVCEFKRSDSKSILDYNNLCNTTMTRNDFDSDQNKSLLFERKRSEENIQQYNVPDSLIGSEAVGEFQSNNHKQVNNLISDVQHEESTNYISSKYDTLGEICSSADTATSDDNLNLLPIPDSENDCNRFHLPSICVDQTPDGFLEVKADELLQSVNEDALKIPAKSASNANSNSHSFSNHCKGKIRYSGDLIEEECESLLEARSPPPESLDLDPQRVSSPVESPARIVKGPQSVTVLRGESVTLAISFSGHPQPTVTWMKGGRVLSEEGRLSVLEGREMSVVTVGEVTADDSGKYVVSVENDGGGDSCFASVAVVGFPEPPGGEPTASEVTDHSLVLSWYGSMYDGGSVVTGYQVEMCFPPDRRWHKVASSVNTSCSVQGLSKGQRYMFRVRAENRYGASHPSKESKVICLDDFLQYDTSSDEEPEEEPSVAVTVETGSEFTDRFDLKEEVGKGRFGTVYRCVEKSSGRPRAAKIIRCLKMKDKEKVRQEIEIMSRLHHPKLMQVLAAFESGRNMIMVMEFISGGELFERVIADDFVLTEQDCILFMRQICNGVAYMHRHDTLHLDLKPENILCKTRTSHKIKIIDFGLARVYKADESLRILFGTPEFVAPEVINYEPVCPASDMWSVGVICYVLLSGLSPFMGDSDTETFANITRGEMDFDDEAFDDISQDAKDFISKLLVKKLRGRMSAEECLNHPWLANSSLLQKRPLSTEKLKRFIIRRKWQKSGTAIRALGRMVSLSRSSLGSSCDSYSPLGSPTSSRSRCSLMSRSETAESGDSDVFQEAPR